MADMRIKPVCTFTPAIVSQCPIFAIILNTSVLFIILINTYTNKGGFMLFGGWRSLNSRSVKLLGQQLNQVGGERLVTKNEYT